MSLQRVFEYVDLNSDRLVGEYQDFLRQPSISSQDKGVKECAEFLRGMMEDVGITARIMPTGGQPIVFGELRSKMAWAKTILIYGHYDVQPPEPYEEWASPPFAAEIRDGRIYARGACDDKQLFVHLKAAEAFLQTEGDVPVSLKFIFEGEEEIASPNLPRFIEENRGLLAADADIGFDGGVHESGRPMVTLGSKGILYGELHAQCASVDLHSSRAAIVQNPAWRLIWAMNSMKAPEDRILIDGWYDDVKDPTPIELEYLRKMPFDEEKVKGEWGISSFIKDLTGLDLLKKLLFQPTCTVTGFDAGYKGPGIKTVLPSRAFLKIDFRLVHDQKPDGCLQKLRTHLKRHGFDDIEVRVLGTLEPSKTPVTAPIARALIGAVEQVWGAEAVVYPNSAGSGPGYLFTKRLGMQRAGAGCGHPFSNAHAPNEFMPIDGFLRGIKASAATMRNFSKT